jgi:tRNA threonylcarbamoyladenosine biosynthesis protein TsaB
MVNAVALEASSDSCSVTLHTSTINKTMVINEARAHSKHLLPLVQSLLSENGIALDELDFVACGNGPGSFTGLRICFGIAQGLAFGLDVPLLTVSSLVSMAYQYRQKSEHADLKVIALLDAHMGDVYFREFTGAEILGNAGTGKKIVDNEFTEIISVADEAELYSLPEAEALLMNMIDANPNEYALIGPGLNLLKLNETILRQCAIDQTIQPSSVAVAEIALRDWGKGKRTTAADAEIVYVRNSVSWDKRKRIRVDSSFSE